MKLACSQRPNTATAFLVSSKCTRLGLLPPRRSVLMDKPVLVMSVSPAFTGGVRAQAQVHETLLAIPARIVTGPQTQAPSRIFSVTLPITSTSRLYASRYRPSTDLPRPVMYVELSKI